ncbi:MAG: endo-1,4-beta-xylanase [Bacillota bacterium]|nr:endo-1,4-beta-xylanase [Bacillota bacterium]
MKEILKPEEVEKEPAGLAARHGFKIGGAIGEWQMPNEAYKEMIRSHFNSLTATNELKAYSLLDQSASRLNPDGMPAVNYTKADEILQFARENRIAVRGHVLVWDYDMTDWFFRAGYDSEGEYVDADTMKTRLQYYIEEVIGHFEEKFPGVIYCWDVVNEAVADGSADFESGDEKHTRKTRDGKRNPFYYNIGKDYVESAFLYARNAVEKLKVKNPEMDIKLFYNDYNEFHSEKRDAICRLVESINSYAQDEQGNNRKLCDGVGMQGYIGGFGFQEGCMDPKDIKRIETAIKKYASLGVEVHITEMAVRNYQPDEAAVEKHADFYAELFKMLTSINSGAEKPLTCVAIWGLCDYPNMPENSYGYRMNGPFSGLFDENYKEKSAYHKVCEVLAE